MDGKKLQKDRSPLWLPTLPYGPAQWANHTVLYYMGLMNANLSPIRRDTNSHRANIITQPLCLVKCGSNRNGEIFT